MKKPENGAPLGFPLISSKCKWCHAGYKGSEHVSTTNILRTTHARYH